MPDNCRPDVTWCGLCWDTVASSTAWYLHKDKMTHLWCAKCRVVFRSGRKAKSHKKACKGWITCMRGCGKTLEELEPEIQAHQSISPKEKYAHVEHTCAGVGVGVACRLSVSEEPRNCPVEECGRWLASREDAVRHLAICPGHRLKDGRNRVADWEEVKPVLIKWELAALGTTEDRGESSAEGRQRREEGRQQAAQNDNKNQQEQPPPVQEHALASSITVATDRDVIMAEDAPPRPNPQQTQQPGEPSGPGHDNIFTPFNQPSTKPATDITTAPSTPGRPTLSYTDAMFKPAEEPSSSSSPREDSTGSLPLSLLPSTPFISTTPSPVSPPTDTLETPKALGKRSSSSFSSGPLDDDRSKRQRLAADTATTPSSRTLHCSNGGSDDNASPVDLTALDTSDDGSDDSPGTPPSTTACLYPHVSLPAAVSFTPSALDNLEGPEWLDSDTIHAFLDWFASVRASTATISSVCLDKPVQLPGTSTLRHRFVDGPRGDRVDSIVLALNLHYSHWVCVWVDQKTTRKTTADVYNSLAPRDASKTENSLLPCLKNLASLMTTRVELDDEGAPTTPQPAVAVVIKPCTRQSNSYDCGVHVLVNAAHLVLGMEVPDHVDEKLWRSVFWCMASRKPLASGFGLEADLLAADQSYDYAESLVEELSAKEQKDRGPVEDLLFRYQEVSSRATAAIAAYTARLSRCRALQDTLERDLLPVVDGLVESAASQSEDTKTRLADVQSQIEVYNGWRKQAMGLKPADRNAVVFAERRIQECMAHLKLCRMKMRAAGDVLERVAGLEVKKVLESVKATGAMYEGFRTPLQGISAQVLKS